MRLPTRALAVIACIVGLAPTACKPNATQQAEPLPVTDEADAAPESTPSVPTAAAPPTSVSLDHPGCFLLMDLEDEASMRGGAQPCDERTVPASTFKVPHALIALDTGVVTDPDAEVKWDGTRYPHMKTWERDHDLRSAIYESVVWFFQGTARAIGRERMQDYLVAFDYGNASVEEPVDRFWLSGGSLRVSPEEQLRFLADLFGGRLPRGAAHLPALREMLVRPPSSFNGRMPDDVEAPAVHPQLVFSAKTGTDSHEAGSVSWLVGHVACPDAEHVFVSRVISGGPPGRVSPAVTHGLAALDQLGVLSCTAG